MIDRRGMKFEPFLRHIEKHLGKASVVDVDEEDRDKLYYFGGGYWRGVVRRDADGIVLGIDLINPSKSYDVIHIVEQALQHLP